MHHQLHELYSSRELLEHLGASWYKVHYLCFPALCGSMYPRWMNRKMKRSVVTARGEGPANEKSTRAAPVFAHTHRHVHAQKQASSPLHASAVPRHLRAYLKVTCRRRWMCGLQPLKCPHEAKELFVSLEELQSLGWDRNGRLMLLSCFHHSGMTLCHRWGRTQLLYETHSTHERKWKERRLGGYFSRQALVQWSH